MQTSPRIEQFKGDVSDMKLRTGTASRETALLVLGIVLMVVGVVGAFVTYEASLNLNSPLDLQSYNMLAITFLTITVVGAAIFVRYSVAKFLRLWLLRQLYESQANTDRIVEALDQRGDD
jgi:hypothetical protein